jgi:hypothetical protein
MAARGVYFRRRGWGRFLYRKPGAFTLPLAYGVDVSTDYGNSNVGVTGQSFGAGTGVRGVGGTGVGVVGYSYSGIGMEGYSFGTAPGIEGMAYSESPAILAYGGSSNDSSGLSFEAVQYDGNPSFWVTNDGNAHVAGLLYTVGSCSKGCDRTRGERVVSYAAQTSFPTIEDVGEGRLAGGQAHIAIDAALSRAIDQGPYVVFVTTERSPGGPGARALSLIVPGYAIQVSLFLGRSEADMSNICVCQEWRCRGQRCHVKKLSVRFEVWRHNFTSPLGDFRLIIWLTRSPGYPTLMRQSMKSSYCLCT